MQHAHLFVDVKERVTRQEETETRIQEKGNWYSSVYHKGLVSSLLMCATEQIKGGCCTTLMNYKPAVCNWLTSFHHDIPCSVLVPYLYLNNCFNLSLKANIPIGRPRVRFPAKGYDLPKSFGYDLRGSYYWDFGIFAFFILNTVINPYEDIYIYICNSNYQLH